MTTGYNFWDIDVWSFVICLAVLFAAMLFANMLRRLIKPLRDSLIPSSVLAGFILLAANAAFEAIFDIPMYSTSTLEDLTYHCLGLGVVAMTFKAEEKMKDPARKRDIFNTGILTVSTYLVQALVGLIITIGLFYLIGSWSASGILLPLGYGQGPGQAFNWGKTFQDMGFENGKDFGLSVAAMGFISASIGGVIYLNIMRRRGKLKGNSDDIPAEDLSAAMVTRKDEIPLSESLDKLTVQFGLIFMAYGMAFGIMRLINIGLDAWGSGLSVTIKGLIWGFNFLFGMLCAFIIKAIIKLFRRFGVCRREYTNNFMLNRISGLMFDIMVVASIASIDIKAFAHKEFIIPLAAICVVGGVVSFFYVRFICNKIFPSYSDAQFLAMYGMLTGTVSTGLILLREADPLYDTPASSNLIYQNLWASLFGIPIMLVLGVVTNDVSSAWTALLILLPFFVLMLGILLRSLIFRNKKSKSK